MVHVDTAAVASFAGWFVWSLVMLVLAGYGAVWAADARRVRRTPPADAGSDVRVLVGWDAHAVPVAAGGRHRR